MRVSPKVQVQAEQLAANAAAAGISPQQLKALFAGVSVEVGFLGFMKKQADVATLTGAAASALAERLAGPKSGGSEAPAPLPEPMDPLSKLEKKSADAAAANTAKTTKAAAAKVELETDLPAFLASREVKAMCRAVGELLNPPDTQRQVDKQEAVRLFKIDVPKTATESMLDLAVYATPNGIRVVNEHYSASHEARDYGARDLATVLGRGGVSMGDLKEKVDASIHELATVKHFPSRTIDAGRADQLDQRPFSSTVDRAALKAEIAAGTKQFIGPWAGSADAAHARATFAMGMLDRLQPSSVNAAEFLDISAALIAGLVAAETSCKLTSGANSRVAPMFVDETLAFLRKLNSAVAAHDLTRYDTVDLSAKAHALARIPLSRDARDPDGKGSSLLGGDYRAMEAFADTSFGSYDRR